MALSTQPALLELDLDAPTSSGRAVEGSAILVGDARERLREIPPGSVRCVITSPPYWGLRDYGVSGQIGAEDSVDDYVANLAAVFDDVRRVLTDDGTLWLNLGDSYTSGGRAWRAPDKKNDGRAMSYRPPTPEGLKPKDLVGVPWRVAFKLQADGWYLRSDIIWHKPNCQPESVRDRPTQAHEYLFLLSKSQEYYYDHNAGRELRDDGRGYRNRRSVWSVNTAPFPKAHFATFPPELVAPCIQIGSEAGDTILDPFFGAGTVGLVAESAGRRCIGIELNLDYAEMALQRLRWPRTAIR